MDIKRVVEFIVLTDKLLPVLGLGSLGGAAAGFWATARTALDPTSSV